MKLEKRRASQEWRKRLLSLRAQSSVPNPFWQQLHIIRCLLGGGQWTTHIVFCSWTLMIKWTLVISWWAGLALKHWIRFIKAHKSLPALVGVTDPQIQLCPHSWKSVYKLMKKMCHSKWFFLQNGIHDIIDSTSLAAMIYQRRRHLPDHQLSQTFSCLSPCQPEYWAAAVTAATLETEEQTYHNLPRSTARETNSDLRHFISSHSEISSSFTSFPVPRQENCLLLPSAICDCRAKPPFMYYGSNDSVVARSFTLNCRCSSESVSLLSATVLVLVLLHICAHTCLESPGGLCSSSRGSLCCTRVRASSSGIYRDRTLTLTPVLNTWHGPIILWTWQRLS